MKKQNYGFLFNDIKIEDNLFVKKSNINNKIINRRNDARGYEIYKETEEYKSKINDSK